MNTSITSSLRTATAILAGVLLSATAALAGESTPANVAGLESFSLRAPVLNDDGSTTLPDGTVLAAPGHATVNEDGSVTFANGKTLTAPTINVDGSITLSDGTLVEPAKVPATVPAPRTASPLLAIAAE